MTVPIALYTHSLIVSCILSIHFISSEKSRKNGGILLSLLVFLLSLRFAKSLIYYWVRDGQEILVLLGIASIVLVGPVLKMYIGKAVNYKSRIAIELAPGILFILLLIFVHFIYPYKPKSAISTLLILGANILLIYYLVKSYLMLVRCSASIPKQVFKWGMGVIMVAFIVSFSNVFIFDFNGSNKLIMSLIYLVAITILLVKSLNTYTSTLPHFGTIIPTDRISEFIEQVESLFVNNPSVVTDPSIELSKFAKLLNLPKNEVSRLLNHHFEMNFQQFINSRRVEKAKEILLIDLSMKIESVAYEVGFSSPSAFYTAFSQNIGMTPTKYRKSSPKV